MPSPPCAPKINPALTTFGKTSMASARDDTLAAAGFCDLSWLRAARDSLVKLANAVPDVSNTASIDAARYFNFDLVVISCILALLDRKSTRLNSSHITISYAVFCLKKKKI